MVAAGFTFADGADDRVGFTTIRTFNDVWRFLFGLDGFFFKLEIVFLFYFFFRFDFFVDEMLNVAAKLVAKLVGKQLEDIRKK